MRQISHPGRSCALLVALTITLLTVGPASGQQSVDYAWRMPSRAGAGTGGEPPYATRPEHVTPGQWVVYFHVKRPACRRGASYRWSVDGNPVGPPRGDCSFAHPFPREDDYTVRLDVSEPNSPTRSVTHTVRVQDWLVVSIGDSVASGEGNPDRPGRVEAKWADRRCHRSSFAGGALAALDLEQSDPHTSVTFVHLACSGATIGTGLLGRYQGIDPEPGDDPLPAQVPVLRGIARRREIDAVLLSVGANDVHFGPTVKFCIEFPRCMKRRFDPKRPIRLPGRTRKADRLPVVIARALAALPGNYRALDQTLPAQIRPRVFAIEYFDPTSRPRGGFCRIAGISRKEAKWAHDNILRKLNTVIRSDTPAAWHRVLGVEAAYQGHGYCARRDRRWVVRLGTSLRTLGLSRLKAAFAGTLHPNAAGHLETAGLIYGALRSYLYPGARARPPRGAANGNQPPGGDPDTEAVGAVVLGGGIAAVAGLRLAVPSLLRRRRPRRWRRGRPRPGSAE